MVYIKELLQQAGAMPYQPLHDEFDWWSKDPYLYWYDNTEKKLFIGSENAPFFAISSWNTGFDFFVLKVNKYTLVFSETCNPPMEIPLIGKYIESDIMEFLDEIPLEVRLAIQPFACYSAIGLRLLKKTPEGIDLAKSNPALFWLLLNNIRAHKFTFAKASELLLMRRRQIAGACGCEASNRPVRILSKIKTTCWDEEYLQSLITVLANPQIMKALAVMPSISLALIKILAIWPGLVQCVFFRRDKAFTNAVCTGHERDYLVEIIALRENILRMNEYLHIPDIEFRIKRMGLATSMRRLHDTIAKKLSQLLCDNSGKEQLEARYGSRVFPKPILAGNDTIEPIQTIDDLLGEESLMYLSFDDYIDSLKQGTCTIYRVYQPERCALLICKEASGMPKIKEIWAFCGDNPSWDAIKAVKDWINASISLEQVRILEEYEEMGNKVAG